MDTAGSRTAVPPFRHQNGGGYAWPQGAPPALKLQVFLTVFLRKARIIDWNFCAQTFPAHK
jgi:hypothetical protein